MEEVNWKSLALESQLQFYETLGSRPYDEIEKSDLFLLKKKVGFATCGSPSELPNCSNYNTGYNEDQLYHIKSVCDQIIKKSDHDPIRFACTKLILYHKRQVCDSSVFRIIQKSGNIFIDAHARVYENWDHFMEKNVLPDCEYCYPVNGEYNCENECLIGFAYSPAKKIVSKTASCLDTVGSVASVAAASVFAASLCVSIAPVVITAAGTTAVCTGVYSVSRNVCNLYDRKKHDQSIALSDKESRSSWISIASSAVGVATFGAITKAKSVVESGKSLTKLSFFGLEALNATSVVFSGYGFVENFIICSKKYRKGTLTKKDVFDLSCELLFLFNAIASAKSTRQLLNNMSAVATETPVNQKKLTKTQKRNLLKRAAKRRAKGLVSVKPNESSSTGIKTTLQLLLFEAVKSYSPRIEDILYFFQSIGHDIACWKRNEMSNFALFRNLSRKLVHLYNEYKHEIAEVFKKVVKYTSVTLDKVKRDIHIWCEKASEEIRATFCTKVINIEDQLEVLINDAESDIIALQDSLKIECSSSSPETNREEYDDMDDTNLSQEAQNLLSRCGDVLESSSLSCKDLEEFGNLFDAVKFTVVNEFKNKVATYKEALEAAKFVSGDGFDLNKYHCKLNISESVGQHMFNETLRNLTDDSLIYKCKDFLRKIEARPTPVWEGVSEGMFLYFGPHGSGDLSEFELLPIVSKVVKIPLCNKTCNLLKNENVALIEINDNPDMKIVCCRITEENTASVVIMVIK
ncbi:uncharacterized protein LOC124371662 [Homalodisca vitripennis]|uniref:uncharacterized protein LOC124371662 n=1 Tax=Homalodisca vitripennis TaxID=197043 RepID=UPI001EEA3840|nr:uncharacterized protein LOC124371662 [Homalodisca vitripennis]XP_046685956.1 uncharacterized protein LOC124371662 [Homalodisca vitripennis]